MTRLIAQHVTDGPVVLRPGDRLEDFRIVQGGTLVGRVLFTERSPAILCQGDPTDPSQVQVRNGEIYVQPDGCVLQGNGFTLTAIRMFQDRAFALSVPEGM